MRLAVYTVLYPAALRYVADFWGSLELQLTPDLDVYMSLDGVTERDARSALGSPADVRFLPATAGHTPAEVRNAALERLTATYDGVILLDADDVPLPGRLAAGSPCNLIW
jgi:hypothetical protein